MIGLSFDDWSATEIEVGGVLFKVHTQLLAMISPVFAAMFSGRYKENKSKPVVNIDFEIKINPSKQDERGKKRICIETQTDIISVNSSKGDPNLPADDPRGWPPNLYCEIPKIPHGARIVLHDVTAPAFSAVLKYAYHQCDIVELVAADEEIAEEILLLIDRFDISSLRSALWRHFDEAPPCVRMRVAELWRDEERFQSASTELLRCEGDYTNLVGWSSISPATQLSILTRAYRLHNKVWEQLTTAPIEEAHVWSDTPLHWSASQGSYYPMTLRATSLSSKREILNSIQEWMKEVEVEAKSHESMYLSLYEDE